jgi:acetyltransferase
LKLAEFEKKTTDRLKKSLYESANINNPVDIIGDAKKEQYTDALDSILTDENVDGAILISTPPPMISLKNIITSVSDIIIEHSKPVMVCCMGVTDISDSLNILDEKKIPHYQFPDAAARSLANLSNYAQWLNRIRTEVVKFDISQAERKKVKDLINRAKRENRKFLPEPEAHEILKSYGFPTLKYGLVQTEKECCSLAENIGYPVALKIVSPDIVHKIDVGGVIINIKDRDELIKVYNEILKDVKLRRPKADLWGIFVQQMAEKGKETIIGMNRDAHFGAMLMFGLGGVYVEALKDVTFRIAPIRELSAYNMIQNIRGYKLLAGVRGERPSDIRIIAECLQRLSQLVTDFEDIVELDINPFIVNEEGKGGKVVDARILIRV